MVLAVLTGWLPGPAGIPLFILGLSLLAVHHEWAERYIDTIKKYADKLGDLIFVNRPGFQLFYDIFAPGVTFIGIILLWRHSAVWMISAGIFFCGVGITVLLGNRHRWQRMKDSIRRGQKKR